MRCFALALLVGLSACASIQVDQGAQPQRRQGQNIAIGETAEASVGSTMLAQYDYMAVVRAVATAPFSRGIMLSSIQVQDRQVFVRTVVGGNREAWCSTTPAYFSMGDNRSVCMFDPTQTGLQPGGAGIFTTGYVAGTLSSITYDVQVPYRVEEIPLRGGFKNELLYQGFDRGVVRVSYREYSDDLARPAYQQDLSYTLEAGGAPTPISFRNARLEVFSAGNNSIRYRVLSGFR